MFGNQNMQNEGNKTIKLILAIGLVTAALIASAGIFYYYAIFTPQLEQQKLTLEKEKRDQERADALAAKKAEEERLAQEKLDQEAKEQQKIFAYTQCLNNAQKVYENNWARNCQSVAERDKVALRDCLTRLDESFCNRLHGQSKGNADCSLPAAIAEDLNESLKERKESCLVEAQNALL